jgi:hypothetical protein
MRVHGSYFVGHMSVYRRLIKVGITMPRQQVKAESKWREGQDDLVIRLSRPMESAPRPEAIRVNGGTIIIRKSSPSESSADALVLPVRAEFMTSSGDIEVTRPTEPRPYTLIKYVQPAGEGSIPKVKKILRQSLDEAVAGGAKTVAFMAPAMGQDVHAFEVALTETLTLSRSFLRRHENGIEEISLLLGTNDAHRMAIDIAGKLLRR